MNAPRAAVLIPCLNEERAIRAIVEGALHYTPHVIVVDDGSSDGTIAALAGLPIQLIRHERPGGVLVRAGHTEAGCDLADMAGLEPASVICEIMNDDGTMARLPELIEFAQEHGLKIGTITDLIHYRAASETLVERCLLYTSRCV